MSSETGKPNYFKIAIGCFLTLTVGVLLIGVLAVLISYSIEIVEKSKAETPVPPPPPPEIRPAPKPSVKKPKPPLTRIPPPPKPPQITPPDFKLPQIERTDLQKLEANTPPDPKPQPAPASQPPRETAGNAPALGLDSKGALVDLADYKGKVVLIDFWATWCDPYVKNNLPRVKEAYAKYHDRGFEIIGVCLNDDSIFAANFMRKNAMTWRQILAPDGYDSPLVLRWKVTDLPTAYLIGKDGKIVKTAVAPNLLSEQIEAELKR